MVFKSLFGYCMILLIVIVAAIMPYEGFWFHLISNLCIVVVVHFYFVYTRRCKWFTAEGAYWVEDGVVFVAKGKKTYALNNIQAVYGTTISYLGYVKSGMLRIDLDGKKIVLVSCSSDGIENFSDSGLYSLYETVLQNNTGLKKDDTEEFLYNL